MLSGIVQLADINDFINPSQSCVKPILSDEKTTKINLIDCLACNGCITSSETILIEEHSINKYYSQSKDKLNIIVLSYQSLESLIYKYNLSEEKIIKLITKILKIDLIFSLNDYILYTLNLCYNEFKNNNMNIINSECPGWICYSEKKIGNNAFKYMSKIKSPQQIFSIIIRKMLLDKFNNNSNFFITSIMPCFDKKIESVRNKNEIDCVISTLELSNEINQYLNNFNFDNVKNVKVNFRLFKKLIDNFNGNDMNEFKLFLEKNNFSEENIIFNQYYSKINFSSNFYLEYILYKIKEENKEYIIERKEGKNKDIKEIIIYKNKNNEIYKRLLIANGFRNIQNIVRNIKNNNLNYNYIELNACPGGCVNGGGQIKDNNKNRELLNFISNKLNDDLLLCNFEKAENDILELFNYNIDKNLFFQNFHQVENSLSQLNW